VIQVVAGISVGFPQSKRCA